MASPPVVPRRSVWPSGSAAESAFTAIVWPAPGRLSTSTAWPRGADSCSATSRVTTSGELPAVDATMSLTGLVGYPAAGSFAVADPAQPNTEAMAAIRSVDGVRGRVIVRLHGEDPETGRIMPVRYRKESSHSLCLHNLFSGGG